jgi:hypothetical protein
MSREGNDDPGEGLGELDRQLRAIRFSPRESLGPEIWGVAPGAAPRPPAPMVPLRLALAAAAVVLVAGLGSFLYWRTGLKDSGLSTVDSCCLDLDGGGAADDGVVVIARGGQSVRRLTIYEDRDLSGGYTDADEVRFARSGAPALATAESGGLNASRFCCRDYDGGGQADDGLLIVGVAPDRIALAAIYEGDGHAPPVLR